MGDAIISVEELSKAFGQHEVLRKIDFNVEAGEISCIVGSSGCGKSTLLYSISGLQRATYGNITVQGIPLARMTEQQELELHQTKIGMIFQAFYLIPSLTIIDNVCLPKIFRGESPTERRAEGMRLLRRFGIAE